METFAPEFSQIWLPETAPLRSDGGQAAADDANRDNAALKALADLVSAARSIVYSSYASGGDASSRTPRSGSKLRSSESPLPATFLPAGFFLPGRS
jgi:hypothetical protein